MAPLDSHVQNSEQEMKLQTSQTHDNTSMHAMAVGAAQQFSSWDATFAPICRVPTAGSFLIGGASQHQCKCAAAAAAPPSQQQPPDSGQLATAAAKLPRLPAGWHTRATPPDLRNLGSGMATCVQQGCLQAVHCTRMQHHDHSATGNGAASLRTLNNGVLLHAVLRHGGWLVVGHGRAVVGGAATAQPVTPAGSHMQC